MSLLTAEEVTNLYLYGSKTKPTNLADNDLIRPINVEATKTSVDINDYMQNGPGRFASPAFFELLNYSSLQQHRGWLREFIPNKNCVHLLGQIRPPLRNSSGLMMMATVITPSEPIFGIQLPLK